MINIFILLCMLFVHIIDDFHLQGILTKMKQKSWWKNQFEELKIDSYLYRFDWLICLIFHAFQWSCMIMIPVIINNINIINNRYIYIIILCNTVIHAIIDHLKCNKFEISLIVDQLVHICQIIITWTIIYGIIR